MTPRSEPIRVVLQVEHGLVASGIRSVLGQATDIEVVAQPARSEAGWREPVARSDVTVVSATADTVKLLCQPRPGMGPLPLVAVADKIPHHAMLAAVRNGFRGFVSDLGVHDELAPAVRAVAAGGAYISPSLAASLLEWLAARIPEDNIEAEQLTRLLTLREREVLMLLGSALANSDIAERLTISEATVRTHVYRIQTKLNLRSRTEAVLLGYRLCLARAA